LLGKASEAGMRCRSKNGDCVILKQYAEIKIRGNTILRSCVIKLMSKNTMPLYTLLLLALGAAWAADGDWPTWRGPAIDGVARGAAPLEWSDSENVAWKAQIPGRGHSSPVVWGEKIFVTTAIPVNGESGGMVEHEFVLFCLDRKTGKILWRQTATRATPHEGYHKQYGSYASNSPVTDGKLVYASFGSRGVYAYDMDGKLVWSKDYGVQLRIARAFGEGMALTLHGDSLLVGYLHEGDSFMVSLDRASGKEKWRRDMDERTTWSMPLVVEHEGRRQVILAATGKVRGLDFATGEVIWECAGLGENVIPAPVYHQGVVIVMSGHRSPNLLAIRLGREGDLTGTDAILWTRDRGLSYTPSPVLYDGRLYFLTDSAMLTCVDPLTGKPYYEQQRLPKPYNFKSSPVAANGKLYLASENDDVIVVRTGEKFEVLATNTLTDQTFIGTPAIVDGEIYLRGQNTLFCIRSM
jgi:outer membrane protein assembly factor BamB